jgi:hypothetical protein
MKYLITPIWFASFFENEGLFRTNRETRCRKVQLNRSTPLATHCRESLVTSYYTGSPHSFQRPGIAF